MVKTTLYLPDDLKARVERLAADTRRSEAEVMRAAIDEYTNVTRPRPRPGLFSHGNLASRVDELLDGFGSE